MNVVSDGTRMQVYLRVSVRCENLTFEAQEAECVQFIRNHLNFQGHIRSLREISSAYSRAPMKLRELIYKTMHSGDVLVVKRVDRFSRNRYIGKTLLDKALERNITVYFVHEKLSVTSAGSRNYETVLKKFTEAQEESEKIGARIKKAHDARIRRSVAEWKSSVDRLETYNLLENFISKCRESHPDVDEVNAAFAKLFSPTNPPMPLEFVDNVGTEDECLITRFRKPMTYINIVNILEEYQIPFVGGGEWTVSKARSMFVGKRLNKRTASTTIASSVNKRRSKRIPPRMIEEEIVEDDEDDDCWDVIDREMARLTLDD